jgi:hypothetical protein
VKRYAFGFFALWPVAMFVVVIASMFLWGFEDPSWFSNAWIAGTLLFMGGWLTFIWDVWHNPRVLSDKRGLWTAVLFFAGPWAMPFYFWFYVR